MAVAVPVNTGVAPTVTGTLIVLEQPLAVPVREYVIETVGLATTVAALVVLSPVAGDHEYAVAPEAVSDVLLPLHTVVLPDVVTFGSAFTVTAIALVAVQPLVVPVTVYVVLAVADVLTLPPVVALSPVAGVHV